MPFIGQPLPDSESLTRRAQCRRPRNPPEPNTCPVGLGLPQYMGAAGFQRLLPEFPRGFSFARLTLTCWPSWPSILCLAAPSPLVPRLRYA